MFWVVYKHALKNAIIPVLTIIGLQMGMLLGGAILTETIFAWPGIGRYIYDAIGFQGLSGHPIRYSYCCVLSLS